MKLKVINKNTQKVWIEENTNHSWSELALEMIKNHKDFFLIHCDIEGLVKLNDTWYILDECGKWEYVPEEYYVEEIK